MQIQSKAINKYLRTNLLWNLRVAFFMLFVGISPNSCNGACANKYLQHVHHIALMNLEPHVATLSFKYPLIVGTQTYLLACLHSSVYAAIQSAAQKCR